jgi:hypothetical protein
MENFRGKQFIEHARGALIFSTILPETLLILRKIERDLIKNVYWSICKSTRYF